jgi:pimeloyl-ACP methyl ester carboxylesterase
MIDIGGRKFHLLCAGRNSDPSVIIDVGNGDNALQWIDVLQRTSGFAHVCAYDRAGLGWSDVGPEYSSFDDRANDLHKLLAAAKIQRPFILVGHSLGGNIVRRFAALYPDAVAGVVLVDAPEEELFFNIRSLSGIHHYVNRQRRLGWETWFGVTRVFAMLHPSASEAVSGVTADDREIEAMLTLRSSKYFAEADEMASYFDAPAAWRTAGGMGHLGDKPLVVISRAPRDSVSGKENNPLWQEAQRRLTHLSSSCIHIWAERSGHLVYLTQPDVIADSIRALLNHVKATSQGEKPSRFGARDCLPEERW